MVRRNAERGNGEPLEINKFRNCPPLLGVEFVFVHLDHVCGVSGQSDLDGDERIVAERRHCTEMA